MFEPISVLITREQIKQYAAASGDFNPIHTDPEAAKKAGLKDCIVHGMLVMAMGSSALREWGIQSLKEYDVRFQAMTYPDELLFVKGEWTDRKAGKGNIMVENEAGEIKMKGTFTA
ncbi:hypothetical protein BTO30_09210 [Domibacillus antri]|uniref:MaoC-like domain-containing protein n=1 Tax=Domibacillus antri TaxID=1714264 RepID=A0A1Q8Q567_9BACI|nr:MaoC family dehydratase [Domibacillus antri]OLN22477.1 hypothetical protein BTO30_09210 [Domibacillus antri]